MANFFKTLEAPVPHRCPAKFHATASDTFLWLIVGVLLITAALIDLGVRRFLVAARPIYHICRWKINEITARNSWKNWRHSYYYNAKLSGSPAAWVRAPGTGLSTLVI